MYDFAAKMSEELNNIQLKLTINSVATRYAVLEIVPKLWGLMKYFSKICIKK